MSKYFTKSNNESTVKLFNKRTVYKSRAQFSVANVRNIVDFNLAERCWYGKVDNFFTPIYIKQRGLLKPVNPADSGDRFVALNFVADLFNEMALEFQRCAATRQIDVQDPYLTNLKVYKAFEDPNKKYTEYINTIATSLNDMFTKQNILIENFQHFLQEFVKAMPQFLKIMPFTFPAYIKTRENPMSTSGLAIEIASLPYEDDERKKEIFLQSRNWPFFVNACNKYGFLIDYNAPWRIVCDIKAPEIQPYIQPYFDNADVLLNTGYTKASLGYMQRFVGDLNLIYNKVRKKLIVKPTHCSGRLTRQKIRPPTYSIDELYEKYGLKYFLKLYMRLRLWEEKPQMSDAERRRIMQDVILHSDVEGGHFLGLQTHFEKFINKPFDKRYSFTYTINVQLPAQTNAWEKERELDAGFGARTVTDNDSGY